MDTHIPNYIRLKQQGILSKKIKQSWNLLTSCTLCPRQCKVNRTRQEKGYCSTGEKAVVASFSPHFGEEPQLVGDRGSGTIFFAHCSLKCVFCQNHDISIHGAGQKIDTGHIAAIMLDLQRIGCHNINLVTPSHVVPQILRAVDLAIDGGLTVPLIYNCSGYESIDTLDILNGIIDIYMPDFKFWDSRLSERYCNAPDYPRTARTAVKKMFDQVGDLKVDTAGIAYSGLLVRHLVMPGNLDDTYHILKFLKEEISPHTHVNLMSQYRPMGNASKIKAISSPLTPQEFKRAIQMARKFDLKMIQ